MALEAEIFGTDDHRLPWTMSALAAVYRSQERFIEAEALFQRALAVLEAAYGPEHPDMAQIMEDHAILLRNTERGGEAEELETRAEAIRAKPGRRVPAN